MHKEAPVITRNDVSKTLSKAVFGKRSNNAGVEFYTPTFSIASIDDDIKWLGPDWIVSLANKTARRIFGSIYLENLDEEGKLNVESWQNDAERFTTGFAKLGELETEIEELMDEQQALVDKFSEMVANGDMESPAANELKNKMMELAGQIKPLRLNAAAITEEYKERVAIRKAKKEAAAAAKAA